MEAIPLVRPEASSARAPTVRGLAVAYLLVPATLVALWALSEPALAGALLAGAVAALTARMVYVRATGTDTTRDTRPESAGVRRRRA